MVRQRNQSDCVIAAVANATGVSYKSVKQKFGVIPVGGMEMPEVRWILSCFGLWREFRLSNEITVKQWLKDHFTGRYVAIIVSIRVTHAIAIVNGNVYGDYTMKPHATILSFFKLRK